MGRRSESHRKALYASSFSYGVWCRLSERVSERQATEPFVNRYNELLLANPSFTPFDYKKFSPRFSE